MAKKVLVVEDTPNIRQIIVHLLKQRGYEVIESGDGAEGETKAKTEKPALLVLDAMLPNKSGFEVCADLKENPATSALPILMLTAITQGTGKSDEFWRQRAKSDAFVSKPFKSKELLEQIEKLIGPP
jgi:DNA-binding response OmpR family regulator